jgi:signal transduction histidine kinase
MSTPTPTVATGVLRPEPRSGKHAQRLLRVRAELTARLYREYPVGFAGSAVGAGFLVAAMWDKISRVTLIGWFIAWLLSHAYRFVLYLKYRRQPARPEDTARWNSLYLVGTAITGCILGSAGEIMFIPGSLADQMVVLMPLFILATGAMSHYAFELAAFYAFSVPVLGPIVFNLAREGTFVHFMIGGACLFLSYVGWSFIRSMHKLMAESLMIRYEKADLVEELSEQKAEADRARQQAERSRQEAEEASRAKSKFLAAASHDLRTPLNAIIGFSEVLQARMFGELNNKQAEYVDDIHSSGQHLLSLINDLLDLAKIESGRMEFQPSVIDLKSMLEDSVGLLRETVDQQGLTLELDVDDSLGSILADGRMLKRIMLNLLSNAVKFTPSGGRVSVLVRGCAELVEISVCDTGIGISAEDQSMIFEEFRRVGGAAARTAEGTGLGLALVKKFVEMHGGRIRVQSQLGFGCTFTVSLPLAAPAVTAEVA